MSGWRDRDRKSPSRQYRQKSPSRERHGHGSHRYSSHSESYSYASQQIGANYFSGSGAHPAPVDPRFVRRALPPKPLPPQAPSTSGMMLSPAIRARTAAVLPKSEYSLMTGICEVSSTGQPSLSLSGVPIEAGKTRADVEAEDDDRIMIKKNAIYSCENCNKNFKEREHYVAHLKSHKKCPLYEKGLCDFEAIPRLVTKHFSQKHSNEPKIFNPQMDPSFQNWVNERTRNYPKREVVEAKLKAEQHKVERGEVLADVKVGKTGLTESDVFKAVKKEADTKVGIKGNPDPVEELMVDFDWNKDEDTSKMTPEIRGILEEESSMKPRPRTVKQKKNFYTQGGSLLEKLLQPEIRKERNHILQCIRFIVNNNYFMPPEDLGSDELQVKAEPDDGDVTEEYELDGPCPSTVSSFGLGALLRTVRTNAPKSPPVPPEELKRRRIEQLTWEERDDSQVHWGIRDVDNDKFYRKPVKKRKADTPPPPKEKAPRVPSVSPSAEPESEADRIMMEIAGEYIDD